MLTNQSYNVTEFESSSSSWQWNGGKIVIVSLMITFVIVTLVKFYSLVLKIALYNKFSVFAAFLSRRKIFIECQTAFPSELTCDAKREKIPSF